MRERVVKDLADGIIESVADVVSSSGYLGLRALRESLNAERERQLSSVDRNVLLSTRLHQLRCIAESGDANLSDAVIVAEDILDDAEQRGSHKTYLNRSTTFAWEPFDEPLAPGLVVGTLTEIGKTWLLTPDIESPQHVPVQLSVWLESELRSLCATAGIEFLDDEQGAFDALEKALSDQREALERRTDVIELRRAAVTTVMTYMERYGMRPEKIGCLGSEERAFELLESGGGRTERRHIHNLRHSKLYAAMAAVKLVHERRARNWVEAFDLLVAEVKDADAGDSIAFTKQRDLRDAVTGKYGVGLPSAKEKGLKDLNDTWRREYEALR